MPLVMCAHWAQTEPIREKWAHLQGDLGCSSQAPIDASLAVFAPSDSAELTSGCVLQIYKRIIANLYAYPGISSIILL